MSAATTDTTTALGKIGWTAKAALYGVTTLLVVQLATGVSGQRKADQRGAIATVAEQPLGTWLLAAMAVGLLAYAIWRAYEVFTGDMAIVKRLAYATSAIGYGSLCVLAIGVIRGSGGSGGDGASSLTARVMELPAGRWLVAAAGAVVLGAGISFVIIGVTQRFKKSLDAEAQRSATVGAIGMAGCVGRGVVFMLSGFFVVRAALFDDAAEARGLDAALRTVLAEPYGRWALLLVALGFAAYAGLCFIEARHRRFDG